MAKEYYVTKKGMFKKPFTAEEVMSVSGNKFAYGSIDNRMILSDKLNPKEIVVYNPKQIGRGFSVSVTDDKLTLTLNYATTDEDIRIFFEFLEDLMNQKINPIKDEEGNTYSSKADLNPEYEKQLKFNRKLIFELDKVMTIFPIMNPIHIDFNSFDKTDENKNMEEYTNFLHNRQSLDYYYMSPAYYKKDDDSTFMRYVLTSDCPSIIPKQAYLTYPYTEKTPDFEGITDRAYIFFYDYDNDKHLGNVPYPEFLKHIGDLKEYDTKSYLFEGFGAEKMQEILDEYQKNMN